MTLRHQMIVWIAGPALLICLLILGVAAVAQYRQSQREVEQAMTRLAASYSSRLDGYLREAAHVADTTAKLFEVAADVPDEALYTLLESNVRELPLVYGSCLAFEPGTRRPATELFAPYVFRGPDGIQRMNIDRTVYDWYRDPKYTWFTSPKMAGRGVWSEPYFDDGAGGILMSTYSAPFKTADKFGGVCTVDIDLPRLRETVGRDIDAELDFVILAADGRYVFHPDPDRIMVDTMFEYLKNSGHSRVVPAARRMLEGKPGEVWLDGWDSTSRAARFSLPFRPPIGCLSRACPERV